MKKKAKAKTKKAKGQELNEAELEQAVGGVALAPDTTSPTLMTNAAEQDELLQVQMAMQQENRVFTSVSNVLKIRHDTTKNPIKNIR